MIDIMNTYYVYIYFDPNDIPFYIGKGQGPRYEVQRHLGKSNPNRLLKNKIRKVGVSNVKIHFLHKDISEEESFYWESYWIKHYGRRDQGKGPLCNLTNGGDGISGYTHTDEAKQKISKMMKGYKHTDEAKQKIGEWSKNFVRTEDHCAKISAAQKGKLRPQTTGENHGMYGKHHSVESIRKMGEGRKGKTAGEVHYKAKLTEEDVLEIRKIATLSNYDRRTVAKEFDVSTTVITNIVKRKAWAHI